MRLIPRLFSRRRRSAKPLPSGTGIEQAAIALSRPAGEVLDPHDPLQHGRLPIKVYTDADGLPLNSITALAVDEGGYLWVGTQDGLAVYNGHHWSAADFPSGTTSKWVKALVASSDGGIWAGMNGAGLLRFAKGAWTVFDTTSGLPHDTVRSLLETEDDDGLVLWVGTEGGLARLKGGRWTTLGASSGVPDGSVWSLLETRENDGRRVLWVGTGGSGLVRLRGEEATRFDVGSGLPSNGVWSLLETVDGNGDRVLWVGTRGGLAKLQGGVWTVVNPSPGSPDNGVWSLLETDEKELGRTLWVGMEGGLARFQRGAWRIFDTSSGLPNDTVWCLLETREKDGGRGVWAGTGGGGLARLRGDAWTIFDTGSAAAPGLPNPVVLALLHTDDGAGPTLWAGTDGGGLARLRDGEWTVYDVASGLPHNMVMSLLETVTADGKRTLWVGTGGGLAKLTGGEWTVVDTSRAGAAGGLPSNRVWSLLETRQGNGGPALWVGTGGGLARLSDGERPVVEIPPGLPTNGIMCLLETTDADGAQVLWVGTIDGLVRVRDGGRSVADLSSGLPSKSIWSLFETRAANGCRTIWVGMFGGGLAWRDADRPDGGWKVISDSTTPALPNNSIYRIEQDRQGRLYLLTNKGVCRLTPLTRAPVEPSDFTVETFTLEDGLPSLEGNAGASMVDRRGRIWFGTVAGIAVFDPASERPDGIRKRLHVERVLVNREAMSPESLGDLRHDEKNLQFEYALLSYFRESDTRYRTQLIGYERLPSEWSGEYRRTYTNLPAGDYTFRVYGRDWAGNVSGPVDVRFRIEPAPWRTWWAYLLYAGAATGVGYGAVRYRVETLKRQRVELEAMVESRTAELAESEAYAREQAAVLERTVGELKRSERNAREAREHALEKELAAVEASKAKSRFLANMSHELRTPLNSVLGFAQLMERDRAATPAQRETLAIIQRSGEHLLGLINDVLSIAKIEAGRLTLNPIVFDLPRMLKAVEEMIRVRAESKGLLLHVALDGDLPRLVHGDDGKLRQVLINLLGNAVKFTDEGTIRLTGYWEKGRACFEIEDTGPGIAADELGKLFEPFSQTESGRRAGEGTGLGLAISRNMIRLMGGDILVESHVGRGTIFRFEVDLPASNRGEAPDRQRRVRGLAPGQRIPLVLVVDDVTENRMLLARLLESVGFEVREASNGKLAVEHWESWRPDLIWMDQRMPVMDGAEATRRIRAAEAPDRRCTIVALTASALEHDREAILATGCDDFVTKPFREAAIFETLARHLGVRFEYDDPPVDDPGVPSESRDEILTAERLAAIDRDLLVALSGALQIGDLLDATNTVEAIHEVDEELGREIAHAIGAFQFEEILRLLDVVLQPRP
jgi:signal transduction histidine kinase/ligand-binding sensor domain-containing protein/CheY-like chemotaxis protein